MIPRGRSILFLCASFLVCFLVGCEKSNVKKLIDIGDGGVISGTPCSPPCFQDITPGITTEEQAFEILSSLVDIKTCDQWEKNESGRNRGIRCSNIGMIFNDLGIVNGISFEPSESITVDEIIKKQGDPDAVNTSLLGVENQPPVAMMLYFDNKYMVIYLPEQDSKTYNLESITPVRSIAYFDQNTYKKASIMYLSWKGYGEY